MFLEVKGLQKHFKIPTGMRRHYTLKAVDGIDMTLGKGVSYGLVGESGSGKSTVARLILRLLEPTSGAIHFEGTEITGLKHRQLQPLRREMQIIFQDPHSSLNPRKIIYESIAEPLVVHRVLHGAALRLRLEELMEVVGLNKEFLFRYPHELSGGQKQRACIARAVALNPKLLVLDEPTSALDVSVQAQILEFLRELQDRFSLTYLFISHNLAVIRYMCNRVAVMYLGKIVEEAQTATFFADPQHPYSRALLDSVPLPQAEQPEGVILEGAIPSPIDIPPGCRFQQRCPQKMGTICETEEPLLKLNGSGHNVACHLYE